MHRIGDHWPHGPHEKEGVGVEQVPATASVAFAAVGLLKRIDWSKASLWVRYGRFLGLGVRVGKRRVPATWQKGFMGAEVEVTVANVSKRPIVVRDIRLMLSGAYGAPVESSVPGELTDPALPATLDPGAERRWYLRGEKLSQLLAFLFHPPKKATAYEAPVVTMYARCLTSSGRIGMSPTFEFPTDVNAHWP